MLNIFISLILSLQYIMYPIVGVRFFIFIYTLLSVRIHVFNNLYSCLFHLSHDYLGSRSHQLIKFRNTNHVRTNNIIRNMKKDVRFVKYYSKLLIKIFDRYGDQTSRQGFPLQVHMRLTIVLFLYIQVTPLIKPPLSSMNLNMKNLQIILLGG